MESNNNNANHTKPTAPIKGKRNILVTSALPYVNNVPHLGNIVGSTLSADVFSRYCKSRGENCIYICGTDEYGTATETKALQEGVTPKEICDKYYKVHSEIYEWFDIKFDKFGRTSTPEQTAIAQDIFLKLNEKGYLFPDSMQQLYCEKCQKFLADRFVEGTCPLCGYADARGDQCDKCGKLLNAIELINPACKVDGSRPVVRSTEHMFLDLAKISAQLEKWVDEASTKGKWTDNAIQITRSWIREGLKPRCITRDLKWGTPVPLEQFKEKVFYVWFDAPIGYISITATYTSDWELWWKNPQDVQLYQFMGKDNVPFHTVIFPASLMAGSENWTLLHHVSTTEYLNYEGGKFSKSRNLGVFGNDAKESGIPVEVWRYYLLINRPENSDSSFSWDDLAEKVNGELLANLGNLANRVLNFIAKFFDSKIPEISVNDQDREFIAAVNEQIRAYLHALDHVSLKEGLKIAMGIGKMTNKYLQDTKAWDLIKTDKARCGSVIGVALNAILCLATLLEPYMPSFTAKVLKQLNWQHGRILDDFQLLLPAGHQIGVPEIIFKKIDADQVKAFKARYGAAEPAPQQPQDVFPADLRGGVVVDVQDHPTDENLFVAKLNLGENAPRTVVARLKSVYTRDELLGRQVVALCNLPVADLKGVQSEAMMLVAEGKKPKNKSNNNNDEKSSTALLQVKGDVASWPGTRIVAEGLPPVADGSVLTLKEFQKLDIKLTKEGHVAFKGKYALRTVGENLFLTAPVEAPAKIK